MGAHLFFQTVETLPELTDQIGWVFKPDMDAHRLATGGPSRGGAVIRTTTIAPGYIRTPGVATLEEAGRIDMDAIGDASR